MDLQVYYEEYEARMRVLREQWRREDEERIARYAREDEERRARYAKRQSMEFPNRGSGILEKEESSSVETKCCAKTKKCDPQIWSKDNIKRALKMRGITTIEKRRAKKRGRTVNRVHFHQEIHFDLKVQEKIQETVIVARIHHGRTFLGGNRNNGGRRFAMEKRKKDFWRLEERPPDWSNLMDGGNFMNEHKESRGKKKWKVRGSWSPPYMSRPPDIVTTTGGRTNRRELAPVQLVMREDRCKDEGKGGRMRSGVGSVKLSVAISGMLGPCPMLMGQAQSTLGRFKMKNAESRVHNPTRFHLFNDFAKTQEGHASSVFTFDPGGDTEYTVYAVKEYITFFSKFTAALSRSESDILGSFPSCVHVFIFNFRDPLHLVSDLDMTIVVDQGGETHQFCVCVASFWNPESYRFEKIVGEGKNNASQKVDKEEECSKGSATTAVMTQTANPEPACSNGGGFIVVDFSVRWLPAFIVNFRSDGQRVVSLLSRCHPCLRVLMGIGLSHMCSIWAFLFNLTHYLILAPPQFINNNSRLLQEERDREVAQLLFGIMSARDISEVDWIAVLGTRGMELNFRIQWECLATVTEVQGMVGMVPHVGKQELAKEANYLSVIPSVPQLQIKQEMAVDLFTFNTLLDEVVAMMGPSGSGKTSLLSLLGARVNHPTDGGSITYKDQPYSKFLKSRIGFVTQDDVLFPHLTVKETLIGGSLVRGVSGGERKRVGIGNEIIINPSLRFLDETTPGLDSTTALRIVQMLHDIAEVGKTVVTLH